MMDENDEFGLTEHDRSMARQTAREFFRLLHEEIGKSVLEKVFWAIIMFVLGGGISYFTFKR